MSLSADWKKLSPQAREALLLKAIQRVQLQQAAQGAEPPPEELRGSNRAIQQRTDLGIVLSGPAGTGKSRAVLRKLHTLAWRYPRSRLLIVRKVRVDLVESTLVTYERDILSVDNPICSSIKRTHRQVYRYPNGSEVAVGGMDRPGKMLSAEYDFIFAGEASQFTRNDWEIFTSRLRSGVMPYQQLIGDTNPDSPKHWIRQMADAGDLTLLETTHRDNPRYWDAAAHDWTARGRDYVLGKLAKLTGLRRARYYEGKWVQAEGAVYDTFDERVHVIDRFPIPSSWRWVISIDFGYVNPFVCQFWALDNDDRMYLVHEIYYSHRLVAQHAAQIASLLQGKRVLAIPADHDAEDRATLAAHGVHTTPARKDIRSGIQLVQARLNAQADDKPRLFIFRDALEERDPALASAASPCSTLEEMPAYIWQPTADGKTGKETPVDKDNHGMDAMRYAVAAVDRVGSLEIGEAPPLLADFFGG
jgi:phage terminase large subunit